MVKYENHLGVVEVSHEYFSALVGRAASHCYGVIGMANRNAAQGLLSTISRRDTVDKGVLVRVQDGHLVIDLHIIVLYGINISTIVKSIVEKVRYTVEEATGFAVSRVNVYVDGMRA